MPRNSRPILMYVAVFALVLLTALLSNAQTFSVLYSFKGGADGKHPYAGPIVDSVGSLYGTTLHGGTHDLGTVFKVTAIGTETVLYSFTGGADGARSYASLIRDASGNLYGTTFNGGNLTCSPPHGCGVVFKLDTGGNEIVLHTFGSVTGDGRHPHAGLVRDTAGNLYGTTLFGGDMSPFSCVDPYGCGTVFKVDTVGIETVLHEFGISKLIIDGDRPYSGLTQDAAGNLYGTTFTDDSEEAGSGVVYKLDASGAETVLDYLQNGAASYAGLVIDAAGNLYGTASYGGSFGYGAIIVVYPQGTEGLLYSFVGTLYGQRPHSALVRDDSGNLYGTTQDGIVFKIDKTGNETILHSFTGGADGGQCYGGLVRDSAGNFYGTTTTGGAFNDGVVFKIAP